MRRPAPDPARTRSAGTVSAARSAPPGIRSSAAGNTSSEREHGDVQMQPARQPGSGEAGHHARSRARGISQAGRSVADGHPEPPGQVIQVTHLVLVARAEQRHRAPGSSGTGPTRASRPGQPSPRRAADGMSAASPVGEVRWSYRSRWPSTLTSPPRPNVSLAPATAPITSAQQPPSRNGRSPPEMICPTAVAQCRRREFGAERGTAVGAADTVDRYAQAGPRHTSGHLISPQKTDDDQPPGVSAWSANGTTRSWRRCSGRLAMTAPGPRE